MDSISGNGWQHGFAIIMFALILISWLASGHIVFEWNVWNWIPGGQASQSCCARVYRALSTGQKKWAISKLHAKCGLFTHFFDVNFFGGKWTRNALIIGYGLNWRLVQSGFLVHWPSITVMAVHSLLMCRQGVTVKKQTEEKNYNSLCKWASS